MVGDRVPQWRKDLEANYEWLRDEQQKFGKTLAKFRVELAAIEPVGEITQRVDARIDDAVIEATRAHERIDELDARYERLAHMETEANRDAAAWRTVALALADAHSVIQDLTT